MSNPNPTPLHLENPLDIDDGRRAARRLADQRRSAEAEYEKAIDKGAEKERDYRREYAKAILGSEGTAIEKEAHAKAATAQQSYERDIAAGMVKAHAERLRGLEGERAMLRALIEWSMRMRLDEREPVAA